MSRVLEGHFESQPAVWFRLFGEDGQRSTDQFLAAMRVHSGQYGDLVVAAAAEPDTAFLPGLVQIDQLRPLRGLVEFFGRQDSRQPIGAVGP